MRDIYSDTIKEMVAGVRSVANMSDNPEAIEKLMIRIELFLVALNQLHEATDDITSTNPYDRLGNQYLYIRQAAAIVGRAAMATGRELEQHAAACKEYVRLVSAMRVNNEVKHAE